MKLMECCIYVAKGELFEQPKNLPLSQVLKKTIKTDIKSDSNYIWTTFG